MAPISNIGVLAFASAALAVPHAQWQPWKNHGHRHHGSYGEQPVGTASGSGVPFPYPTANATGIYGSTGTAGPTGISSAIPSVYPTGPEGSYGPSPVGPETDSAAAPDGYETNIAVASDCTEDVTVTSTERVTVTVTAEDVSSAAESAAPSSVAAAGASSLPPYPISSGAAPGTGSYPAGTGTGYATGTGTAPVSPGTGISSPLTSTVYATTTYTPSAPASSSEAAPVSDSSSSEAPAPSSYAAPSSSSEAAPVSSAAPPAPSSYAAPSSSSEAAPVSESSAAPPAPSSYAAPSSSAAPAPTGYSGGGGKRGLAYNDVELTKPFLSSPHIGWAYNWGSDSSGLNQKWKYIPTLWGDREDFTGPWATNAQAAIDAGAEYLFGFNEPDEPSQSNLTPEYAAGLWKTHMEPFAGKAKLVAPSVTNGQNGMGLDWLSMFMGNCTGCHIDAVNQHWYDSTSNDCDYFKQQVTNATTVSGKPVFVGEYSFIGDDDDIKSSMKEVLPWLDANDDVLGYAYFMVDNQLSGADGLSAYGKTYKNYS